LTEKARKKAMKVGFDVMGFDVTNSQTNSSKIVGKLALHVKGELIADLSFLNMSTHEI
jgi:hypothetical protein